MTKTEKIIEALERKGAKEIVSKSMKYRAFTFSSGSDRIYFVGKRGALRVGRVASKSVSITHRVDDLIKDI